MLRTMTVASRPMPVRNPAHSSATSGRRHIKGSWHGTVLNRILLYTVFLLYSNVTKPTERDTAGSDNKPVKTHQETKRALPNCTLENVLDAGLKTATTC